MYFYILDKMVCAKSKEALLCEVFETEHTENRINDVEKCKNYCGYKGINSENVNESVCEECKRINIVSGKLYTTDNLNEYPIIQGIPRMLTEEHLGMLFESYKDFINKYKSKFKVLKFVQTSSYDNFNKIQSKTQKSFGNEWETFNTILPTYEDIFHEYFRTINIHELEKKNVLDAGCGMGRWAYFVAKRKANVFAMDFSKAVDEAYKNLKDYSNAHVIQADIYNIPFKEEEFDLVYSLGVLHHLPNPFKGFKTVVSKTKKNFGGVLIYLYYALDNKPWVYKFILSIVTMIRKITTKLPKFVLFPTCFIMSVFFKVVFVMPSKIFDKLKMKTLVENIPLNYYKDKKFKILYNDTVDRFSAPVENRYTREQIRQWFKNVGINDCIIPEGKPNWCAYGVRESE